MRLDSPELALGLEGRGECDGVVESQAEGVVRHVVALATVEQVLLQVVTNGEKTAARRVDRAVLAVWAQCTLGNGTYNNERLSVYYYSVASDIP